MRAAIIPAVIPTSRHHLDTMLARTACFADMCQVDLVDGSFALPASWPYTSDDVETALIGLRFDTIPVELDLMVARPEEQLDLWQRAGPARVVVHVASTAHIGAVLEHAATHGYQLGLAFGVEDDVAFLAEIDLAPVDCIQLMGIATIGSQGQSPDDRVFAQIERVRRLAPALPVSIDGGVSEMTLPKLARAGAHRFVAGSAIWSAPDPAGAYRELAARAG
jgi:ribulose-phosphate 3-epimerase